jgi:putative ABC transport system substrate-binding protein
LALLSPIDRWAARAGGKRPTVGFLVPGTQAAYAQWLAGFVQRMRELGWIEGGNVEIIYRWTDGVKERYAEIAAEFVMPGLQRLAILTNPDSPGMMAETASVQGAARTAGLEAVTLAVRRAEEITAVFDGLNNKADALYCVPGPLTGTNRVRIVTLALAAKLPAIYGTRNDVDAGGLMSYGPDVADLFRRAAGIVDKILRGTKPADIPVEQPTKLLLFVNLTTAKALGLAVPQSILLRADDLIE